MAELLTGYRRDVGDYYLICEDGRPNIEVSKKNIKKAARDGMNLIHDQLPDGAFNSTIVKLVMDEMKEMMYFLPLLL